MMPDSANATLRDIAQQHNAKLDWPDTPAMKAIQKKRQAILERLLEEERLAREEQEDA